MLSYVQVLIDGDLLVSCFEGCMQWSVCGEKGGARDGEAGLRRERLLLCRHCGREFCGFEICGCYIFFTMLPD